MLQIKVILEVAWLLAGLFVLFQVGVFFRWLRQDLTGVFAQVAMILREAHQAAVNVTETTQAVEDLTEAAPSKGLWGVLHGWSRKP